MSQNKTIVPGVDYNSFNQAGADELYGSLYSRSEEEHIRTVMADSGTQMVGAVSNVPASAVSDVKPSSSVAGRTIAVQERVIVGVLFSITRGVLGEMFPLYLGRNIIGTNSSCDVVLNEKTVSGEHAILYITKTQEGIAGSLTDYNSSYGTQVNDEDTRYETATVSENNIITIGLNYRFVVKYFDTDALGLHECSEIGDNDSVGNNGMAGGQDGFYQDFYRPSQRDDDDKSSRTVMY